MLPYFGIIKTVIEMDTQSTRFENYANQIVSTVEQVAILSTSGNYDLGRDGTSISNIKIFVCSSLQNGVDAKSLKDLTRLKATKANPAKVYFCSNRELTEDKREKLREDLRSKFGWQIEVFGSIQLAQIDIDAAERSGQPSFSQKYYRAEIDDCLNRLTEQSKSDSPAEALRLALMAMGASPQHPREELGTVLILALYSANRQTGLSVNEICGHLTRNLKLGSAISSTTVRTLLRSLEQKNLIIESDDRFYLDKAGEIALDDMTNRGAASLLLGRQAIHKKLESLLGRTLTSEDFNNLWVGIEDQLAHAFYTRGSEIVATSAVILTGGKEIDANSKETFDLLVAQLADSAAKRWSDPTTRNEISTAVCDLFSSPTGAAADWLVGVCGTFVALCSLGLEVTSSSAYQKAIADIEVVPDTDILLSLLCEGEGNHLSLRAAHFEWLKIGGRVLLAEQALFEVAYHAWIATEDFKEVQRLLPVEGAYDTTIKNSFVRAFNKKLLDKTVQKHQWAAFISQFRGDTSGDTRKVKKILSSEFRISDLPSARIEDSSLAKGIFREVSAQLKKPHPTRSDDIALDKADKDCQIIAALDARRAQLESNRDAPACYLITSATRLQEFADYARRAHRRLAISPATWLHLVSMLPGVALGMEAMRSFLFEGRIAPRLTDFERRVLRAVRESGIEDFGISRRVTLFQNVQEAIVKTSVQMDLPESELRRKFVDPKSDSDVSTSAGILSEALSSMSIDSAEVAKLKQRVAELERALAQREHPK